MAKWIVTLLAMLATGAAAVGAPFDVRMPTLSEAYVRIYTDENLSPGSERYSPIGGTVYPVLFVRLGAASRVSATGPTTLTFKVRDTHPLHVDPQTGQPEPAATRTLGSVTCLSSDGWEKLSQGAWVSSEAPTTNEYGQVPVLYRHRICGQAGWDTCTEPLGHNGTHAVFADDALMFEDYDVEWSDPYEAGPTTKKTLVSNLVIDGVATNTGNPYYFVYDPSSENPTVSAPTISGTFRDADPHTYVAVLVIVATDAVGQKDDVAFLTQPLAAPGAFEFEWDGLRYDQSEAGAGTYTFDIAISEDDPEGPGDTYIFKMDYLLELDEEHAFEFVTGESIDSDLTAKVSYTLNDVHGRDATEMAVHLVNPVLQTVLVTPVPTTVGVEHTDVPLGQVPPNQPSGRWHAVWCGLDGHAAKHRDHRPHCMLSLNQTAMRRRLRVVLCAGHGAFYDAKKDAPRKLEWRGSVRESAAYAEDRHVLYMTNATVQLLRKHAGSVWLAGVLQIRNSDLDIDPCAGVESIGCYDHATIAGGGQETCILTQRAFDLRVSETKGYLDDYPDDLGVFIELHTTPGALALKPHMHYVWCNQTTVPRLAAKTQALGSLLVAGWDVHADDWSHDIGTPETQSNQVIKQAGQRLLSDPPTYQDTMTLDGLAVLYSKEDKREKFGQWKGADRVYAAVQLEVWSHGRDAWARQIKEPGFAGALANGLIHGLWRYQKQHGADAEGD